MERGGEEVIGEEEEREEEEEEEEERDKEEERERGEHNAKRTAAAHLESRIREKERASVTPPTRRG